MLLRKLPTLNRRCRCFMDRDLPWNWYRDHYETRAKVSHHLDRNSDVGNVHHNGLTSDPARTVYLGHAQTPGYIPGLVACINDLELVSRIGIEPEIEAATPISSEPRNTPEQSPRGERPCIALVGAHRGGYQG